MLPRPGKPSMPDVQFRMREFRLANGLRIIVEEDHATPLVGVFTVVGVGSSGDPAGKEGIAHLVEHLAFRAKTDQHTTVWNQLEQAGTGFLNASTYFDETMYFEVGSKDLLPKLLAIEAARLTNPIAGVDQGVLDVEREVVRNELRQRGENAIGPALEYLQEAVFPPSHQYARPIGGSHQSLSAISFDDVKKFVSTHYRPSNMTMLILGDVDLASIEPVLAMSMPSLFRPLPPTTAPFPPRVSGPPPAVPEPPAERLLKRHATVATPELYVVWSLPRSFDTETVLLDFVRAAASAGLSGAFISDPDIVNVDVFPVPGVQGAMLVARASLRKGDHVEKSYERMLDQLVNIWVGNVDADATMSSIAQDRAFGRMRNGAVMEMTVAAESLASRGMERVMATHFTGDPLRYGRKLKALIDVSPGQVSHFSEQYLTRDRARAVLVEPFPPDKKDASDGPTGLAPAATEDFGVTLTPQAVSQLGNAHQERAKFETVVRAKRDRIVETLPNGLKVVIRRRHHAMPIVAMRLVFGGGSVGSPAAQLGMQVARPRAHGYGDPAEFGIEWWTEPGIDSTAMMGVGANGNLSNMLAQLSERASSMYVEGSSLAFVKSEFLDYIEKTEQLPPAKANRALRAALFGTHPYGVVAQAAEEKKVSASEIEDWFSQSWTPSNAVLTIAGDIDAEETLVQVKQWFGGWKGPAAPKAPGAAALRTHAAPTVLVTNQPGATQVQLQVSCLASGQAQADELANETLSNLLATYLFEKVRGELGASYGIHGEARTFAGGTAWLDWGGNIENTRLPQVLKLIHETLGHFEEQTLTDQRLGRARWQVARSATLEGSTSELVARQLAQKVLLGRDPDEGDHLFEALAQVGQSEVAAAWKTCSGNLVLSLVGDEALIRQATQVAGF